jgi:hypothetical protein
VLYCVILYIYIYIYSIEGLCSLWGRHGISCVIQRLQHKPTRFFLICLSINTFIVRRWTSLQKEHHFGISLCHFARKFLPLGKQMSARVKTFWKGNSGVPDVLYNTEKQRIVRNPTKRPSVCDPIPVTELFISDFNWIRYGISLWKFVVQGWVSWKCNHWLSLYCVLHAIFVSLDRSG